MRFQDLPEDILAQILDGETSAEAIGLWRTWNRQIMAKLANGGVRELKLEAMKIERGAKWPQCLKLFKLKSLRIVNLEWRSSRPIGPQLRAELRQLHGGLETLEIEGKDVETAFELRRLEDPKKSKKKTSSRKGPPTKKAKLGDGASMNGGDEVELTPEQVLQGDWNMNSTHPNLKNLTISAGSSFTNGRFPKLVLGSVAFLPRSLTYLDVSRTAFAIDPSECIHLPPQLRTLVLPESKALAPVINEHNIRTLPPSLTSVNNKNQTGTCYTIDALYALAKDEKEILPNLSVFPQHAHILTWYNVFREAGTAWRSNTFEMSIDTEASPKKTPSNWVDTLPPSWATSWTYYRDFKCNPSCGWLLEALPKMLVKLTLEKIDWKTNITLSTWPATLASLCLIKDKVFSREHFPLLPRTLTELSSNARCDSNTKRDWLLQGRTCLSTIDEQIWSRLKRELYDERDREIDDAGRKTFDDYIAEVENGALHGLPLTIEILGCKPGYLEFFPPRLKRVDFEATSNLDRTCPLRALPPHSLTDVNMRFYNRLDENHLLGSWPKPDEKHGLHALKTSKSLKKLSLDFEYSRNNRCDAAIPWLPRDLRELRIRCRAKIPHEALRPLPSNLSILWINGPSVSNDWAESLPRALKELYLPLWFLEGPQCSKMPPSLERLVVRVGDGPFTIEQFNELPSTLHHGLMTYDAIAAPEEQNWKIMIHPNPLEDDTVMARNEIGWRHVRKYMAQFIEWRAQKEEK